jgi:hypothetical protein
VDVSFLAFLHDKQLVCNLLGDKGRLRSYRGLSLKQLTPDKDPFD